MKDRVGEFPNSRVVRDWSHAQLQGTERSDVDEASMGKPHNFERGQEQALDVAMSNHKQR